MSYVHLNARERMCIFYLSQYGLSLREIGRRLRRSHSTISRELSRNQRLIGSYCDQVAQHYAQQRKTMPRHQRRLRCKPLYQYVCAKLKLGWSPDMIAQRIQRDHAQEKHMRISAECIYQWVYRDAQAGGLLYRHLVRTHSKRRKQRRYGAGRGWIPNRIDIDQRPDVVDRRTRFGDWEGDTMVGYQHQKGSVPFKCNGLVDTRTDANGVVTSYTYNVDGLLQTMTETPPAGGGATRITQYEYDSAGNVDKITTPDSIVIDMTYDEFNRRLTMENNLGEKVTTIYDAEGNVAETITSNPDASEVSKLVQQYDPLNRLTATELPHDANTDVTVQRAYDLAGNMTSSSDAKNNSASMAYDDGNRLLTETNRDNGLTQYSYDDLDNITQVIAPNGATTTYVYDSLSRQTSETSPDRGAWAYSYDLANNLKTVQDARGITATYTYDDLNRVTAITYPDTTENVTFTYDNCTYGVGRLCSRTDESGTYHYTYDAYGNVTQEVYVGASTTFTTSYQYDAGHRLVQMTLPTGRVVDISRDGVQRIDSLSAFVNNVSTTLVSNIQYDANNLVTSRTYGNGLVDARNYDLQSRLLSQTLGGIESVGYSYDLNGNVTQRNPGSITHAYDYDVLDRLIEDTLGGASTDYGYDANHNRVLATQGGNSISYSMSNNSNQLESIDSTNLTYDANGNLTADGQGKTYFYNDANRLARIEENGQVIARYTYNAAGQRKTKVTPTTTTVYHYDLGGNLISETTPAGSAIKDYIWQGNEPVVQIDVAGTETITYLHTDHLMTARLGTDSSGTIIWRWESDAFGQTAPEEDVDNNGINTTMNLRFPGQYYDLESGLHYNWNRYYNPNTGKYITSDPIGLNGGSNTFVYGNSNSLSYVDLLGLACRNIIDSFNEYNVDRMVDTFLSEIQLIGAQPKSGTPRAPDPSDLQGFGKNKKSPAGVEWETYYSNLYLQFWKTEIFRTDYWDMLKVWLCEDDCGNVTVEKVSDSHEGEEYLYDTAYWEIWSKGPHRGPRSVPRDNPLPLIRF